jgi:hypothetical protein
MDCCLFADAILLNLKKKDEMLNDATFLQTASNRVPASPYSAVTSCTRRIRENDESKEIRASTLF